MSARRGARLAALVGQVAETMAEPKSRSEIEAEARLDRLVVEDQGEAQAYWSLINASLSTMRSWTTGCPCWLTDLDDDHISWDDLGRYEMRIWL